MNSFHALHNLWLAGNRRRWRRFHRALDEPARLQARYLARLLTRNRDTDFGREHGFATIRTVRQFQQQIPLRTYDDLLPWIERVRGGASNVLTREPVRRLIPSSGSSAARKLIPYTTSLQREFNRAIGPWIVDLYRSHPQLKAGPAYWSISPPVASEIDAAASVPIGFDADSAYLGAACRRIVEHLLVGSNVPTHDSSIDRFRYVTALHLLRAKELRLVSVWHPSFFLLLMDAMRTWWASLCDDIAHGTCSPPAPLPEDTSDGARPDRQQARELEGIGPDRWCAVWPRLTVISCWDAAHAAESARQLAAALPQARLQGKGLLATEGFVSLPIGNMRPLAVTSHFFEFLSDAGTPCLAHELERGGEYEIVLTTGGGLYRYRLGDRVRVDGFARNTPSLTFLGRADRVSDRVGEKLNDAAVAEALREVLGPLSDVRFAMLAPQQTDDGASRYTLYLEAPDALPSELPRDLERALRRNPHYRNAVDLGQLRPSQVQRVGTGAAAAYVHRLNQRGTGLGDIKPTGLSDLDGWERWFRLCETGTAKR